MTFSDDAVSFQLATSSGHIQNHDSKPLIPPVLCYYSVPNTFLLCYLQCVQYICQGIFNLWIIKVVTQVVKCLSSCMIITNISFAWSYLILLKYFLISWWIYKSIIWLDASYFFSLGCLGCHLKVMNSASAFGHFDSCWSS